MAATFFQNIVTAGLSTAATGAQPGVVIDPRMINPWVVVLCGTFGTSITCAIQHANVDVAAAYTDVLTLTTITSATYFKTSLGNTSTNPAMITLLPYVRFNISAISGTMVFTYIRLYYDLRSQY